MGLRFRKTINLGPFRMTASKSGISTSFGVKGARVTKMPNGSTRTTLSIPGTGISHVTESKGRKKSTPPIKRKGGTSVTAPVSDSCAAPVYPMTIRAVGIICCFIGVLFMGLIPLVSAFGIIGRFYI